MAVAYFVCSSLCLLTSGLKLAIDNNNLWQNSDLELELIALSKNLKTAFDLKSFDKWQQSWEEVGQALDDLERKFEEEAQHNFMASQALISQWDHKSNSITDECTRDIQEGLRRNPECADPWPKTKICSVPYALPNYRLGDLFYGFDGGEGSRHQNMTLFYFPDSIASKYLRTKTRKARDYEALDAVVNAEEYARYEKPDLDTLVVHVRGFDALVEQQWQAGWFQKTEGAYRAVTRMMNATHHQNFSKVVLVTGDHRFLQDASKSQQAKEKYENALRITQEKLNMVRNVFTSAGYQVLDRVNMNADCDFVYMINAKFFLPSGGTFDQVIEKMAKRRNSTIFLPHD